MSKSGCQKNYEKAIADTAYDDGFRDGQEELKAKIREWLSEIKIYRQTDEGHIILDVCAEMEETGGKE